MKMVERDFRIHHNEVTELAISKLSKSIAHNKAAPKQKLVCLVNTVHTGDCVQVRLSEKMVLKNEQKPISKCQMFRSRIRIAF